jgi:hypothetical protein
MRNILLITLFGIVGFFFYRDYFAAPTAETTAQKTAAQTNATAPQPPSEISAAPNPAPTPLPTPDSLARRIESLGGEFEIRMAVDRMAKEWERRRVEVSYPGHHMQQVGEKQFAVIVRRMQRMQLYEEKALERIVRVALEHERPESPPSQREILLQGIFQTMRTKVGAGAP